MAELKGKKNKKRNTFTVAIVPDDGSEAKGYENVSSQKLVLAILSLCLVVAMSVALLIALTPLKTLLPGYGSATRYEKRLIANQMRLDSLSSKLLELDRYNQRMKNILGITPFPDSAAYIPERIANATPRRQFYAKQEAYLPIQNEDDQLAIPDYVGNVVSGTLSQEFLPERSHYGIDIATASNEPIGAFSDGTVLFADWNYDYGYTLIIDHGGLISFYKHCNKLLVREAAQVKRGEVVALAGNTGHESSGPHLHLEMWTDGIPVNPADYIQN
ncbi:Peptidase M23 [Chloroherpeton thalassium ATCC 35110]|uniref:Peptidase M23 n=1 Tax=Chloroherpeton thalassium (strain ATCC 35110 / GB-78) TaxID=517418 RepID=B3QZE4_CHLT3|nr:M23 family metallopeptidase [Chloroherpeton thalassium]ACF13837.1 Peptidase M23 [Chloroherpeton thalassium ATCC 35110]